MRGNPICALMVEASHDDDNDKSVNDELKVCMQRKTYHRKALSLTIFT